MFQIKNISKTYHNKTVLDNVDLSLQPREVVALIGENGAGKTTLLEILIGSIQPDFGTIHTHDETIGYVPQEPGSNPKSVRDVFYGVEEWRITYTLTLVDLNIDHSTTVQSLSGGQKTKLALAQVMAQDPEPTILLLDEPTNNIDSSGFDWLERFIKNFHGSVLIATHDRHFINLVADAVIELKNGKITRYGGNYEFYKQQKELEYQSQMKQYEESVQKRKQLEQALRIKQERARKGLRKQTLRDNDKAQFDWHQNNVQRSFSGQARAMQSRIDQLQTVERPPSNATHKIKMTSNYLHDKKLLAAKNIHKSFNHQTILSDLSLEIRSGERWHINGKNGSGKSTLLKILADQLSPDRGEVRRLPTLHIGYFSQDIQLLSLQKTGIQILGGTDAHQTELYRGAKSMGLSADDLNKVAFELSRGQQAKLAFVLLLLQQNDILILDEPSNHLDITTKERLESALQDYPGTLVVASHDTYFVQQIDCTHSINLTKKEKKDEK